jgi:poly(beta-D-mannuronate) lyase
MVVMSMSNVGLGWKWPVRPTTLLLIAVLTQISVLRPVNATEFISPLVQITPTPSDSKDSVQCPAPPDAVLSLNLVSIYGNDDSARDDVDEAAEEQFAAEFAPVGDYLKGIAKLSNNYVTTRDRRYADCTLKWLRAWAAANALGEMRNHTAEFKRATSLTAITTAYLVVRDAASDDEAKAEVVSWLQRLAHLMVSHFDSLGDKRSAYNNHRYWAGLASGLIAVASGDDHLMRWSMETLDLALCKVTPEGALPPELERGKRARQYHLYALAALVPLARIAVVNKRQADQSCWEALDKLVKFTLSSIFDPSSIERLSSRKQVRFKLNSRGRSQLAFLEIYGPQKLSSVVGIAKLLEARPFKLTDLGGDVGRIYGPDIERQ